MTREQLRQLYAWITAGTVLALIALIAMSASANH